MTWEKKLALVFFGLAILFAVSTCFGGELFRAVLCPQNWTATIAQRIDTRDNFDWIVRRTWIAKCI